MLATLGQLPRLEPVWLPIYAPWLNPIEKLWHWLRRDVLKGRRFAGNWAHLPCSAMSGWSATVT